MRSIKQITLGFVIVLLSGLAGCIVAPYGGGRSEGSGYRHEQREHRDDAREERRDDRYDERRH
jgi:hypothetical protein